MKEQNIEREALIHRMDAVIKAVIGEGYPLIASICQEAADMLAADAQNIVELEKRVEACEYATHSIALHKQIAALQAELADAQQVAVPQWVLKEAQDLAAFMARKFYQEVTQFEILDDMAGVISQMSNMATGLQRVTATQTPKMWSVPNPINTTRDFSFYETKTYTVPYYAAPQPPQAASRVPMTDDKKYEALQSLDNESAFIAGFYSGVDCAETHHGIKQ